MPLGVLLTAFCPLLSVFNAPFRTLAFPSDWLPVHDPHRDADSDSWTLPAAFNQAQIDRRSVAHSVHLSDCGAGDAARVGERLTRDLSDRRRDLRTRR